MPKRSEDGMSVMALLYYLGLVIYTILADPTDFCPVKIVILFMIFEFNNCTEETVLVSPEFPMKPSNFFKIFP